MSFKNLYPRHVLIFLSFKTPLFSKEHYMLVIKVYCLAYVNSGLRYLHEGYSM